MFGNKATFILSATHAEHYPLVRDKGGKPRPEVCLVGRSNVGKSSLINHFTGNKTLARTSSTPGKTQLINFFSLGETLSLVDLPGYGFAKVPKTVKNQWGNMIQEYLENRPSLSLILLLCDIRHAPSEDDLLFAQWATHYKKPYVVIFTKTDKLSKNQVASHLSKWSRQFPEALSHLTYSVKDPKARITLLKEIENRVGLKVI